MHKITAGNIADSKPDFVVATQAAATLTLAAGEIGIFVGTTVVTDINSRGFIALQELAGALREANYPNGANAFDVAAMTPPGKDGILLSNLVAMPVVAEDDVLIAIESGFYPAGNSTNVGAMITSLIETFQEQVLKFA